MKTKTCISAGNVRQYALGQKACCFQRSGLSNVEVYRGYSSAESIAYSTYGYTEYNLCTHQKRVYKDWPKANWLPTTEWTVTRDELMTAFMASSESRPPEFDISAAVDRQYVTETDKGSPTPAEEGMAVYNAASRVYSLGIPRIMNLPLAFLELKDTGGTLKSAIELIKFVNADPDRATRVGQTVKQVASAYLAYNFGVKPTVGDVEKFLKLREEGRILVDARPIQRKRGETVRSGFRLGMPGGEPPACNALPVIREISFSGQGSSPDTGCIYSNASGDWPSSALQVLKGTELAATVFGRLSDDIRLSNEDVNGFRARWASPFIGTGWQLVPFTFLVDWVWNIGSYLETLERRLTVREGVSAFDEGLWISISRHSVVKAPSLAHSAGSHVNYWNPDTGRLIVQYSVTRSLLGWQVVEDELLYERKPVAYSVPPLPELQAPFKTFQLTTLAALVVGMIPTVRQVRTLYWRR